MLTFVTLPLCVHLSAGVPSSPKEAALSSEEEGVATAAHGRADGRFMYVVRQVLHTGRNGDLQREEAKLPH